LEAIPEGAIRANTDPQDNNGDGVSGRASEVWSHEKQQVALGRFGWKAGNPSVRQQGSDAFAGDMGLSTRMFARPAGDCTQAQEKCRAAPTGEQNGKPEVTKQMLDLVIFYSQNLAVPKRRNPASPQVLRGKQIFNSIDCVACHIPTFKTGPINGQPHLSNQRVWPYTDLLLHDMGEGLADNRPEGVANGREWRTPPLWGIGLTQTVNGHTFFLHDGRARGIEEAILWHGGEAAAVRDSYAALSKNERDALVAFVNSL
jgi:CxxC motif-containing protein (DUF1111 family)